MANQKLMRRYASDNRQKNTLLRSIKKMNTRPSESHNQYRVLINLPLAYLKYESYPQKNCTRNIIVTRQLKKCTPLRERMEY